jgi:hypothetical protein
MDVLFGTERLRGPRLSFRVDEGVYWRFLELKLRKPEQVVKANLRILIGLDKFSDIKNEVGGYRAACFDPMT